MSAFILKFALTFLTKLPKTIREAIMPDMRIPEISNNPAKVQLKRISHVYFEHADLKKFVEFADDFGLVEAKRTESKIYYRGYGKDAYVYVASQSPDGKQRFNGAAFLAASQSEFDKASNMEGAIPSSLDDAPGGGKMVTFNRVDDTFFHVIYGQEERPAISEEPSAIRDQHGPPNKPFSKPRRGKSYYLNDLMIHDHIASILD